MTAAAATLASLWYIGPTWHGFSYNGQFKCGVLLGPPGLAMVVPLRGKPEPAGFDGREGLPAGDGLC